MYENGHQDCPIEMKIQTAVCFFRPQECCTVDLELHAYRRMDWSDLIGSLRESECS